MMKAISGRNASGKTRYLNELFDKLLENRRKVAYNLDTMLKYRGYGISSEAVARISGMLQIVDINADGTIVKISSDVSNAFMDLIGILLMDVDYILLDEPEMSLSSRENDNVFSALWSLQDIRDIVIVTHNSDYVDLCSESTVYK